MTILDFKNVSIDFPTSTGIVHAVTDVSLSIGEGRRIGFIGESGSGKTTTALSAMRMLASPGFVSGGEIHLHSLPESNLLKLSDEDMRNVRLSRISYIPQGAMNSLNPVMRIENQIWDGIVAHEGAMAEEELRQRSNRALESVGLDPDIVGQLYPHELSGGMKQRVCIAIGVCLDPDLIIADEPTSALDVITQRHVMQTLRDVQGKIGAGLILIGHDMGLMAQSVDEIGVLKKGELVEFGPVRQIIEDPQHPYTRELISSVPLVGGESFLDPKPATPAKGYATEDGTPLLELRSVSKTYGAVTALHPMSFSLDGEEPKIISIVGQSGSGKSTMGSLMLGFNEPSTGAVLFKGHDINRQSAPEALAFRKDVQAVFQDPYACFNPFYRVNHALKFPFERFGLSEGPAHVQQAMEDACRAVGLAPETVLGRYPHQLSGGQRQRLIVARALMLSPKLLIADEPVSMVDASLRATILKNIHDLKDQHGISIVYITHDLATAYHVSDYVMVLYKGHVVEAGPPKDVIGDPQHAYTKLLISSIPWPDLDRDWGSSEDAEAGLAELARIDGRHEMILRSTIPGFSLGVD
ncbi:ABC transporter ATP-binding protein [Jannaschia aquimarina]|uniref:GsiA_1 protein n=1 Tax=Jannaschia aquimarina TaxID=935700 RepID=A0A0D1EMW5_9RHOB|nr:ABC transporter ATP-binding protein [Jannaschia aquimarina]KIT17045.1 Glutathione import ATP-binding protein GsiA [Jannaschia aquimarina]SNS82168.1 peptide/nickel transport system ATP-binding protein [Jannaschia aquimarina]